jgi:hypothetical protein
MKQQLTAFAVALICTISNCHAQEILYRCGNEYTNELPMGNPLGCKLITRPKPSKNWTEVVGNEPTRIFIDMSTVKPQGRYLKAWIMFDYDIPKTVGAIRYSSALELAYYDCAGERSGAKTILRYIDAIGRGTAHPPVVFEEQDIQMMDLAPGTVGQLLADFVCAKTKANLIK